MSAFQAVAFVLLISCSSFLSASEVALFSLSRFQLRILKERFRPSYKKLKALLGDPSGLLITVLVLNEVLNISISTLITHSLTSVERTGLHAWIYRFFEHRHWPGWLIDLFLGTLITSPIILFLCEMTPKAIAARANQVIAPIVVEPLTFTYKVMKPVRWVLKWILKFTHKLIGKRRSPAHTGGSEIDAHQPLREKDFLSMVEEGLREGAIHARELELIKNVFDLDDSTVADIYTPIQKVLVLPVNSTGKEALTLLKSQNFSRVPVYSGNKKNIVGILYKKDLLLLPLLRHAETKSIAEIIKKPMVVGREMRLNTLFRKFKLNRTHLAIVEGASGEALGIVTMTDVLDAVFEDILPEEGSA